MSTLRYRNDVAYIQPTPTNDPFSPYDIARARYSRQHEALPVVIKPSAHSGFVLIKFADDEQIYLTVEAALLLAEVLCDAASEPPESAGLEPTGHDVADDTLRGVQ